MKISNELSALGLGLPEILLPKEGVDLTKWSVVACDQFTSQPGYWQEVAEYIGDSPSTLNLIFPEVYLEEPDKEERIAKINETMTQYLDQNILSPLPPGFILVDRQTTNTPSRKGLIVTLDLERYDYNKGSLSWIRPTEGTVLERLPPRVAIRKNAPIELPHIMVLIDDPEGLVIEKLFTKTEQYQKLYDFDLMKSGGHIKCWQVNDEESLVQIANGLTQLSDQAAFAAKYGVKAETPMLLFAVGDGNHSLATAKKHWEDLKTTLPPEQQTTHPARFASVELVNVHDEGLKFEPIHRVLFNTDPDDLIEYLGECITDDDEDGVEYIAPDKRAKIVLKEKNQNLPVGNLQKMLDEYLKIHPEVKIDYVHGIEAVENLAREPGNLGLLLPVMDKHDLFATVIKDGALPRKTFSMGEAEEKRYYLEARKIIP